MSLCVGEGWLGQGQERCYSFTLQLSACSLRGWRWTRGAGLVLCLWGSPPDALRGHSPSACRANPARSLWSLWSLCPGTASFALSHFALPWLIPVPGFRAGTLFSQNPWLRLTSALSSPVPTSLAEIKVLQAVGKSSGNRRWFSLKEKLMAPGQ